jgi:histidinol phosphatase-like PHP family hydrolase
MESGTLRPDPFAGRYLFHLHTTHTDGQVSVREYFTFAKDAGLERLIFLEHIRAEPRYDVQQFAAEVRACAAEFGVPALVGFEAKVLPGGALDIAAAHAVLADVLGVAEHGFPADYGLWHSSLREALKTTAAKHSDKPVVWVHPGLWLRRNGLLAAHEQDYVALVGYAQELGVKVEWNLRYGLLPPYLQGAVRPEHLVCGVDAHRLADAKAAVAAMPWTGNRT